MTPGHDPELPEGHRLPALPAPADHECEDCHGTGRVADRVIVQSRAKPYKVERGWRRRYLIIQLATGELSLAEIAAAMGVSYFSIKNFRDRHKQEIQEATDALEQEFVGLWVAKKVNRLAEYQQDIEDANEVIASELDRPAPDPLDPAGIGEPDPTPLIAPVWVRLKEQALRAVAEELGQIPNRVRMELGGSIVTYQIVSEPGEPPVDLGEL